MTFEVSADEGSNLCDAAAGRAVGAAADIIMVVAVRLFCLFVRVSDFDKLPLPAVLSSACHLIEWTDCLVLCPCLIGDAIESS